MNKDDYDYYNNKAAKTTSSGFKLGICWCGDSIGNGRSNGRRKEGQGATCSNGSLTMKTSVNNSAVDKQHSHIKASYKEMYSNINRNSPYIKQRQLPNRKSSMETRRQVMEGSSCGSWVKIKETMSHQVKGSGNRMISSGSKPMIIRQKEQQKHLHLNKSIDYCIEKKTMAMSMIDDRGGNAIDSSVDRNKERVDCKSFPLQLSKTRNRHPTRNINRSYDNTLMPMLQSTGDYCDTSLKKKDIIIDASPKEEPIKINIDIPIDFGMTPSISSIESSIMSHCESATVAPHDINLTSSLISNQINEPPKKDLESSQANELNRILKYINESYDSSLKSINSSVNYNLSRNIERVPQQNSLNLPSAMLNSFKHGVDSNPSLCSVKREEEATSGSAWIKSMETSLSTKGIKQHSSIDIDPLLKDLYLKLSHKEEECKLLNDKLRTIEAQSREVQSENNKLLCLINREEAEGEMLQHMLNYLSSK